MPHLWMPVADQWQSVALNGPRFALTGGSPDRLLPRTPGDSPDADVVLARQDEGGVPGWLLLAPASIGVRINGQPLPLGVRALRDKDEIRLPGAPAIYFSTEELTVVEPFPGAHPVDCPRCSKPIEPGTPAVRCPCCQIWYHQQSGRSCFTYAEACTTCGSETRLSEEFQWTPELL